MTPAEFRHFQDNILEMSGKDLAKRLGVAPPAISRWRDDREVPTYIIKLLDFLRAEKAAEIKLPMPLSYLVGLSRAAERRGTTVEALLLEIIRGLAEEPIPNALKTVTYTREPGQSLRVAEDPPHAAPPHKPLLNQPAEDG